MKNIVLVIMLMIYGSVSYADQWVSAQAITPVAPTIQYGQYLPYYYYNPQVVIINVPYQYYAPVTTYQNTVVEKQYWCLFKRYEIVRVPQTVYVPVKY
jgi:hypothetical protein